MVNEQLLLHLVHKIFVGSPDGQQLLKLLKEKDSAALTFPCDIEKQNQHGGALAWAAFRAGQRDFVNRLELMALQYAQLIDSNNKIKRG